LIIWPLPNCSTYDYDAIIKLKPKAFIVLYELSAIYGIQKYTYADVRNDIKEGGLNGGAAGEKMHMLMFRCNQYNYKLQDTFKYSHALNMGLGFKPRFETYMNYILSLYIKKDIDS
jgi:hypothetical protein